MRYHLFALAAATIRAVSAQDVSASTTPTSGTTQLLSVISVLQTALPSSLIQEALTNSAGIASELASQFSAGETPSWFGDLPSDVRSYLVPMTGVSSNATVVITTGSSGSSSGSVIVSTGTGTGSGGLVGPIAVNGTNSTNGSGTSTSTALSLSLSSTTRSTTVTEDGGAESGETGASVTSRRPSSTSTSEAGAGVPTAVVAMGFAGLAGVVGVLAL